MLIYYTAIIGDVDDLPDPPPGVGRAVCFSDRARPGPDGWEFREPAFAHPDPVRVARWCKALAHRHFPEASATVWADALCRPLGRIDGILPPPPHLITCWRHHVRDCVYDEAEECRLQNLDDPEAIARSVARLRARGFPAHAGLHETTILARRHTPETAAFNERWWAAIEAGSRRDQLSFDPSLGGLECWHPPEGRCAYFELRPHKHDGRHRHWRTA